MAKTINTRIQNKHDSEAHWMLATNFIPLAGELIIYDEDEKYSYKRFKIGDGVVNSTTGLVEGTSVNDLPFTLDPGATEDYINNRLAESATRIQIITWGADE